MSAGSWFRTHKRQVITHTSIVVGFVLLTIFVLEPLFDRFEAIPGESKLVEFILPNETANLYYGISRFNVSTHLIDMSGWAFIAGQGSDNSTIYIVLKSDKKTYIFDTQPTRREDVAVAFRSMDLDVDWSGFTAIIPLRKIQQGEYIVGLYIRKANTQALQYITADRAIAKAGNSVKLATRMSKVQEILLPPESGQIRLGIGKFEVMKEKNEKALMEIAGWAFIEGQSAEDSKIYIVLKSVSATYIFDTFLQKRPDVTDAYIESGLNLDDSGFIARIPKEEIEDGAYKIGIYIKRGDIEALQYIMTDRAIVKAGNSAELIMQM